MSKSTAAETSLRVEKVVEFLLQGWSRRKICEYALNEEDWGVSESQIDRYIKKARLEIKAQSEKNIATDYALAVVRLEYLYSRALEQENLSLAARTIKDMISLQTLSRPQVVSPELEIKDIGELYFAMNCYAQAIKSTVTDRQLKEIVSKAMALGSGMNIEAISIKDSTEDDRLSLAVEDRRLIGRRRTRQELERDNWQPIDENKLHLY